MDKKDLAQDKKTAAKAVHKHEKAMQKELGPLVPVGRITHHRVIGVQP